MVDLAPSTAGEWAAGNEAPDGDDFESDYDEEYETDDEAESGYDQEDGPEEAPAIEPKFANVVEFVQGYFLPVIRRRISDNDGGLSWDSRWWAYPEVVARVTALHYAWEEARASKSASAMSAWWVQHLEPHLRVILDGDTGPMANAKADRSFMGWPAMPSDPVPSDVLALILDDGR